jgi:tRNA(fMet)-specific endonuclease VapC
MRLAIDTNRYTDLASNVPQVVAVVEQAIEVYMPFVVLAELRSGFLGGNRAARNEQILLQFLAKRNVRVLYADEQTIGHYALVWNQLRKQGTPIPVHDRWIAALVLQHQLTLYARDEHFDHLPQIPRI